MKSSMVQLFPLLVLIAWVTDHACFGEVSLKVDIYPGFGWDNLRFMNLLPIFNISNFNNSYTFQKCIEMIPIHENKIELDSTVVDLFDSKTHEYASNFMIGGSASYKGFSIGGSYSNEYVTMKKEQNQEKTIALHNQINYLMVDVLLSRQCPLTEQVKKDLMMIAQYDMSNQPALANYEAEMFVKNYGTHYVNRLHLGGSITEEDFISEVAYESSGSRKRTHRVSAQASFLALFKLSTSFGTSVSQSDLNQYQSSITKKRINAKGGDVLILSSPVEEWQASVKSKPAIIRRGIENMTYIVNSYQLPELDQRGLGRVQERLNQAIETYVEMNTIRGCMKRGSPSFNWIANVDDGNCAAPAQRYQFGGFIRTCSEDSRLLQRCSSYRISNVFTRAEQCKPDFTQHLLHQKSESERLYKRECRSCGFLWLDKCCKDVHIGDGWRHITLYSCIKNITNDLMLSGSASILSMNVFGGFYSSGKVNPVTMLSTCPGGFIPSTGPEGLTLCFAERVTSVDKKIPAFGGIFSCNEGNPAMRAKTRECPQDYSLYSMTNLIGSCIMSICLKFETQSEAVDILPILLPPFIPLKDINFTTEINDTMESGVITSRHLSAPDIIQLSPPKASKAATIQSNILVATLILFATINNIN